MSLVAAVYDRRFYTFSESERISRVTLNPAVIDRRHNIPLIDLVCVNLYPFVQTTRKPSVHFEEVIENIDIGGPSMLRAAAKNFQDVAVVTDAEDYGRILAALRSNGGTLEKPLLF